ncbi:MAG: hypothetical protein ACYSU0_12825 [Planctomycetota bacterium]|jgi:hypothetical protein
MSATIIVSARTAGKKKPIFEDWSVPFPPDLRPDGDSLTLRTLITRIVQTEVEAFKKRQRKKRLLHALTAKEIVEGVAKGKVDMGGRDLDQEVDEEQAVGTALQAFEDGLYLVIVDGEEQRDLDRQVFLKPDSRVTFVRLVMLAGA